MGGTAQAGGAGRREGRAYIGSFTTGEGRGITIAAVDPESGALTPRSAVDGLVNPSCLALGGGDGGVLYAVSDADPGGVAASAPPTGSTDGTPDGARAYPSVVRPSADGRFVWVAVRGSNRLLTYSLAAGADAPRLASTVDCGGSWPRDLVTDPSERRLYVANEWSGDVTWFDVDPESGALRRAGAVEVPAAACVVFA
ncbi:hypothetical protein BJP40_14445 [Streptomyces sp. CC53]|uniref:lactonase family protein n=1 Tax=unclassified Streptomyces TaxID=2593676 RepID=UPI0008DC5B62|nr:MULTISPECIES: beta-propeller fold lactonase family protein [unclassified Streptomyces]OII66105.1 hypothetical protein BJP40_14445 [Streptomyces sp. CC53]